MSLSSSQLSETLVGIEGILEGCGVRIPQDDEAPVLSCAHMMQLGLQKLVARGNNEADLERES
jgi:hypothetical protein